MIKECRSCGSGKLIDVITLGESYLSDFVEAGSEKPKHYPLNVVMCEECTLVQLKDTVPSSELYTNHYGYRSGINNTMRMHLKEIVESARKAAPQMHMEDVVVDIGANDGTLLKNYPQEIIRIGFDPVEKFGAYYDKPNLVLANTFFDAESYFKVLDNTPHKGKKAKIITAISMFYDLDDPNKFVSDLAKVLDTDGVLIIQQNYLVGMIQNNAFDNIVHEHLEYYSLTSLSRLLNRHGLEVVDVEENDLNGGSFRTYVKHMNRVRKMRMLEQKMKINNPLTYQFVSMNINSIKNELLKFVKEAVAGGKTVYVYGASTRGNTLLQYCGLDCTLIKAAVERNRDKWGKVIASSGIPIISEDEARRQKPDYFLVLPWFFKEEIIKREEEYIKAGGSLIFPLPDLSIVNAKNYSSHTKLS